MTSRTHTTRSAVDRATAFLKRRGGIVRTSEALRARIHPRTLYELRDAGKVIVLERGLYRLSDAPPLRDPDLAVVAAKAPRGVICLISALAFHDLTTQIPHEVYLAVERGTGLPRLKQPPLRVFQFSGRALSEGIETHDMDGTRVRIYSPEKTLADCFKFRNKLGLDVVLEALRLYRERRKTRGDDLLRFGKICRVANVMRPYLEAIMTERNMT